MMNYKCILWCGNTLIASLKTDSRDKANMFFEHAIVSMDCDTTEFPSSDYLVELFDYTMGPDVFKCNPHTYSLSDGYHRGFYDNH